MEQLRHVERGQEDKVAKEMKAFMKKRKNGDGKI